MTTTDPDRSGPARRLGSRRVRLLVGLLALVVIIGLSLLVWYIFFRPAGPPAIGPGAPVIPEGWRPGQFILAVIRVTHA